MVGRRDVRISLACKVSGQERLRTGRDVCPCMCVSVNLCLSVDYVTVVQYFVCICKCVNPLQGCV